jgi:hypothetical protein
MVCAPGPGSNFADWLGVWPVLAVAIDFVHAILMAAWVLGLPLLFWHKRPLLSRGYCLYALAFVAISQLSYVLLGECFLTTLARACALRAPVGAVSEEWFTVRVAQAVFRLTPSHRGIKIFSEALIFVTAVGMLCSLTRLRSHPERSTLRPSASGASRARPSPSGIEDACCSRQES